MPLLACKTAELIAGYTLRQRIGAGGYGEVWMADAPGGLIKAVKCVYGYLDEERAARELKALSRIKEVRHPFLLSLERIEVVDGRLVIVTELADASLKDRFDQYRKQGLPGIPREELIVYLRDAADGLDYMCESFSLQHLDIKPENLLIVGGRAKVADFGLVKDIQEATMSLAGLTPVYAAPEVFDGHPSLHSDQYSLAIVYQEMLTGELPFPGRTPQQLASQHLATHPRLLGLPPGDRGPIGRALSKNPDERFPNCRAMIDALVHAETPATSKRTAAHEVPSQPVAGEAVGPEGETAAHGSATNDTDGQGNGGAAGAGSAAGRTLLIAEMPDAAEPASRRRAAEPAIPWPLSIEPADPTAEDLPPLDQPSADRGLQPTLVIGIGGTGAMTLRRLRQRLHDRFVDLATIPALQFLLLDTDPRVTSEATVGDPLAVLDPSEVLDLPLHNAEAYRGSWEEHLRWIGRRWLCNMPRSRKTEGIRPLGRLALVDHRDAVLGRLRAALTALTGAESLAASAQHTGMPVEGPPRVVIVASIAGGTGGGMALDLAYMVRMVLGQLGLADARVTGILTHSTDSSPSRKLLSSLNSCACMREWSHYNGPQGYPGDESCGLPPVAAEIGTFDDTYLVELGEGLDDADFQSAVRMLAEYLYADLATAVGGLLGTCRRCNGEATNSTSAPAADAPSRPKTIRSFALHPIGPSRAGISAWAVDGLCYKVVQRWLGEDATRLPSTDAANLQPGALMEQVREALLQTLGDSLEAAIEKATAPRLESLDPRGGDIQLRGLSAEILKDIARMFEMIEVVDDMEVDAATRFQPKVEARLKRLTESLASTMTEQILASIDAPGGGVKTGMAAIDQALDRIRTIRMELAGKVPQQRSVLEQAARTMGQMSRPLASQTVWSRLVGRKMMLSPAWLDYARLKLDALVLQAAGSVLRNLQGRLGTVAELLSGLRWELSQLRSEFQSPTPQAQDPTADAAAASATSGAALVAEALEGHLDEVAARLDQPWREHIFAPREGLRACLGENTLTRAGFADRLRRAARSALFGLLSAIDVFALAKARHEEADLAEGWLEGLEDGGLPASSPPGRCRLWLSVPSVAAAAMLGDRLKESLQRPFTMIVDPQSDAILGCELTDLSAAGLAARWIDGNIDHARIATRLTTRIDVDWAP